MRYICTQRLDSAYLSHLAKEAATVFQDKAWVNLELSSQVVCCVTLWMNTRAIIYKAGLGVVNNKIYFTVLFGFFCFAQVKEKCFAFGCTQWQLDFLSVLRRVIQAPVLGLLASVYIRELRHYNCFNISSPIHWELEKNRGINLEKLHLRVSLLKTLYKAWKILSVVTQLNMKTNEI